MAAPLIAAPQALIVIGTTGSSTIADDLQTTAQSIQQSLVQRGFKPEAIEILAAQPGSPKVTREAVLTKLRDAQKLAALDEYWLVLLGFSGRTADDAPAFQTSGPRLTASDLKTALDAIPSRQYVFVGTSDSGGFVPVLLNARRDVLAATSAEGEVDLPRFAGGWAEALKSNPHASWRQLAASADELTKKTYAAAHLAVGEHARLGDPATGKILAAPFAVDTSAASTARPAMDDGSTALVTADDIKVVIHKPNSEWEPQPATSETRRLMAEATAAPNSEGFNAVMLEQRLGYKIGDDRTAESTVLERVYIAREDAVSRWANFELPQNPPAVTTKLLAARIIQPDGSATVYNPAKMPEASDCSSGLCGALTSVFIPGAHAGCLVEIAYRTRRLLDASGPDYSEELPVQQNVPVLATQLQLQIPAASHLHFKLRNLEAKAVESDANGVKTFSWKLAPLPGFEALPYDPPAHDLVATLAVSSLDSWDQFAAWYRRLSHGADAQDATVKAMAESLASTGKDRVDKIRKAFEFVSSLRYIAMEFGVNGIRPRTPTVVLQNRYGDCKDKANLLIALLADMGIDARFCLLNRGSSTDPSFPAWEFNHAIAFVPKAPGNGQPEDLWLDTTDSTAPFPTLSPGDVGRNALVFDKDAAKFMTVTAPGQAGTDYAEQWKLNEKEDGRWDGKLQTTWGGLAEYEVRGKVRGLTPLQRNFVLQSALSRQMPAADFDQLNLTAADDLSAPLKLTGAVQLGALAHPLPAFDFAPYFAAPTRNRPLLINNGQKVHLVQNVDVIYHQTAPGQPLPPFEAQAAGIHATAQWQKVDDRTFRRTAELKISQPLVAAADYAAVRNMLRQWNLYLSQ